MQNISLSLKPYHLAQLREAVRARAMIVSADTDSTVTDKAVCADLEERVNLLARAVATEQAAKEARRAYNCHINSTPEPNGRRKRLENRTQETTPKDNAVRESEPTSTSSADVVKRPV